MVHTDVACWVSCVLSFHFHRMQEKALAGWLQRLLGGIFNTNPLDDVLLVKLF